MMFINSVFMAILGAQFLTVVEPFTTKSADAVASGSGGVRIIGTATNSFTGNAVIMIGDYNRDGLSDFAVSAVSASRPGKVECGLVVIILGQGGMWTEIDLTTVTSGLTTRRILGGAISDNAGTSLGPAGDVNQDGFDDLLVGASGADFPGRVDCGAIYVIFGMASRTAYTDIDLAAFVASATVGYTIYGPAASSSLGNGVLNLRALGDINGDSIDDFAVSAPFFDESGNTDIGAVWFVYGTTATPVDLDLSSLGSAGVRLIGEASSHLFGASMDNVGDFNGDGKNDTIIGAYGYSSNSLTSRGAAYLLYGTGSPVSMTMSAFVTGAVGVRFIGAAANVKAGSFISGAGDINGDGRADLLISASKIVYVIYGNSTLFHGDFDLSTLSAGPLGYTIFGILTGTALGVKVSRGGDLDQDGVDDFLLGNFNGIGRVYVLYGSTTIPSADIDLATYDTKLAGFNGGTNARFGYSLSGGVDVTGDGIPDILVGARTADVIPVAGGSQRSDAGACYLLTGPVYPWTGSPSVSPTPLPTTTFMPTINPSERPSEVPSELPSLVPSCAPSAGNYSDTPSAVPSETPSLDPTGAPSLTPTLVPSEGLSSAPTESPTFGPTTSPSADPTIFPSVAPSVIVTVEPTHTPSDHPTLAPVATPTTAPSGFPTLAPSVHPSLTPSAQPTFSPSALPTSDPSRVPSVAPTQGPTAEPTTRPTVTPTWIATAVPTGTPTARPTQETANAVILGIQQDMYFIDKADYDSQKVQCNLTIQHTVAASIDGVIPERVTDINVVEEEQEGGRQGNMRALAVSPRATAARPAVSLKYKVTVYDPVLSAEVLTAQLKEKVQSGEMNNAFHAFAVMFNATKMQNGTFSAPQVTVLSQEDASNSSDPDIGLIVGVAVGGFLFLCLVIFALCACRKNRKNNTTVVVTQE